MSVYHSQLCRLQPEQLKTPARIDRSRPLRFTFDGGSYEGFAGDTLASALLANGVRLFGRSFKYHRARGLLSAGDEEPNALVQLEKPPFTEPNIRATEISLYEGLSAKSQNRFPSLQWDIGSLASLFAPILPAGFYYKTFMFPHRAWRFYEYFIRHAAGLGQAPREKDPERYETTHDFPDILVVGSGLAGMEAAQRAAESGAQVLLVEQDSEIGGNLLYADPDTTLDGKTPARALRERVETLSSMPNLKILTRTCVSGYYQQNFLLAFQQIPQSRLDANLPRQRCWRIRAKHVILATGAHERMPVFPNNDLPGVMLSDAVRAYIRRYAVLPGREVVIFTNNDSGYRSALTLQEVGAKVTLLDWRRNPRSQLALCARTEGIPLHTGCGILEAQGGKSLERIVAAARTRNNTLDAAHRQEFSCDLLAVSAGFLPRVHLFSQSRGRLRFDPASASYRPDRPAQNTLVAGSLCGAQTLSEALQQGRNAAQSALRALQKPLPKRRQVLPLPKQMAGAEQEPLPPSLTTEQRRNSKKAFVDFQNDVTVDDIRLAVREGYRSIEHIKRYTTSGMGTDQGKTSNTNALALAAQAMETPLAELGTTTFRPPYKPQSFGAFVGFQRGTLFQPTRTTPMHSAHVKDGATFEDVGDWRRPWFYPKLNETMPQAVEREVQAVRTTAGLFDGSTLGKIDIRGPDAVWLLNMLYTNRWDNLPVGRCRYAVMLNEHGMIFDDGVTARLAEDHFHMTTTTGGAAHVLEWIEEWLQTEWPQRKVFATSVTEQWAVCVLCGPQARAILQGLCAADLSPKALPFMSFRTLRVAGIGARVFRISFSGESAFEINVPARYGLALWALLEQHGKKFGLSKYGTEAVHVLRAEKGFLIPGQDTDGTVTPFDAGLGWLVDASKPDFLGKRSLARSGIQRAGRKQLVGLVLEKKSRKHPKKALAEGLHLIEESAERKPGAAIGHITSSYYSPTLERGIALALIKDGNARKGKTLLALDERHVEPVVVVDPVFFDKKGARMRA